ncbi:unnamed protein product [Cercopithifilaria johnstoni]|uniref:Uncharacterized protein n=1 Tax=Cercopithifilaria johnstoni TaxID=2874296 RepID=A0A8J2PYW7_9BILA|nr:unnamed protein product [Cercopithifilaria johnstoni]
MYVFGAEVPNGAISGERDAVCNVFQLAWLLAVMVRYKVVIIVVVVLVVVAVVNDGGSGSEVERKKGIFVIMNCLRRCYHQVGLLNDPAATISTTNTAAAAVTNKQYDSALMFPEVFHTFSLRNLMLSSSITAVTAAVPVMTAIGDR